MNETSHVASQDIYADRPSEASRHPFKELDKAHLQQALDSAQIGIWELDIPTGAMIWSDACKRLFGLEPEAFDGTLEGFFSLVYPEDRAGVREASERAYTANADFNHEFRVLWPNGSLHWLNAKGHHIFAENGEAICAVGTVVEITDTKETARALQRSEERYRAISELTADYASAYLIDSLGELRLDWISDAFTRVTGFSPTELQEVGWGAIIHPDDYDQAIRVLKRTLTGQECTCENRIVTKSGETRIIRNSSRPMRGPDGAIQGVYAAARDITPQKLLEEERERLLADALHRADQDPLTGLYNHHAFHRALKQETDRANRQGTPLAVAVLDLDNFKFFNDAYGHLVGDEVLCQVAGALRSCCRSYDTLSRYGGDEFAMLISGLGQDGAKALERRLSMQFSSLGYRPPGYDATIPFSLSVGIAIFPDDGQNHLEVLRAADERLRQNKSGGPKNEAIPIRRGLIQSVEGFAMLDAMVTSVDAKDRYTRRHSEEVLIYSLRIARALGLDDRTLRAVRIAALLHDVGKVGVPDSILRKPGRLTYEEMEAVKRHSTMGAAIVGAVPGLEETLDAIRHHHERWDGTGYPCGLRGAAISLPARLIAVADAYSAMTTDRPYRKAMEPGEARAALRAGAGTQWDPDCVEAFLRQ